MNRRILAIILAGMMALLTACGGSKGSQQPEQKPQEQQQEQEAAQEPSSPAETAAEPASADGPSVTEEAVDPNAVPGRDSAEEEEESSVWNIEGAGLLFTVPKSIEEAKGVILERGGGETVPGSGVTYYAVAYLGVSQEEYGEFLLRTQEGEPSEEEVAEMGRKYRDLFTVYSVDGGKASGDPKEFLSSYLEAAGIKNAKLEKMAEVEGYTFFFSDESSDENLGDLGEFEAEYRALTADMENIKNGFECIVPVEQ